MLLSTSGRPPPYLAELGSCAEPHHFRFISVQLETLSSTPGNDICGAVSECRDNLWAVGRQAMLQALHVISCSRHVIHCVMRSLCDEFTV